MSCYPITLPINDVWYKYEILTLLLFNEPHHLKWTDYVISLKLGWCWLTDVTINGEDEISTFIISPNIFGLDQMADSQLMFWKKLVWSNVINVKIHNKVGNFTNLQHLQIFCNICKN